MHGLRVREGFWGLGGFRFQLIRRAYLDPAQEVGRVADFTLNPLPLRRFQIAWVMVSGFMY